MIVTRIDYSDNLKNLTEMKCGSHGDYHDLYLTTDVLFFASAFEAFREVCHQTYGLGYSCDFTAGTLFKKW